MRASQKCLHFLILWLIACPVEVSMVAIGKAASRSVSSLKYGDLEGVKLKRKDVIHLDDLGGLITNIGVIAALALSIFAGYFFTITIEEYEHYQFNYLMHFDSFRSFAVATIDALKPEDFSWNFTMGDKVINLREVAASPSEGWEISLDHEVLSMLLKPVFPMHKMLAWSSYQNPDDWNLHHPIQVLLVWCWWSCIMLVVSLLMTVLIYIFLVVSPARESEASLKVWSRFGFPLIVLATLLCAGGILVGVSLISSFTSSRFPAPRVARFHGRMQSSINIFAFAMIFGTLFVLVFILIASIAGSRKEKSKHHSTISLTDVENYREEGGGGGGGGRPTHVSNDDGLPRSTNDIASKSQTGSLAMEFNDRPYRPPPQTAPTELVVCEDLAGS